MLAAGLAGDGSYAVDASPALTAGIYTAQTEQEDGRGNVGLSAANTFTVTRRPATAAAAATAGARPGSRRRGRHRLVRCQRAGRSDGLDHRGHAERDRLHDRRQRVPERQRGGLRLLRRMPGDASSRARCRFRAATTTTRRRGRRVLRLFRSGRRGPDGGLVQLRPGLLAHRGAEHALRRDPRRHLRQRRAGGLAARGSRCASNELHAGRTCTWSRFSSGNVHGSSTNVQPIWEALYEHGVDADRERSTSTSTSASCSADA